MNGGRVDAALLVEVPDAAELGSFRTPAAVRREAVRAQEQVWNYQSYRFKFVCDGPQNKSGKIDATHSAQLSRRQS